MLCLTQADFNNILNFVDFRASEITVHVNDKIIAARDIVSRFVSNTDVVLDRVDPEKLALKLHGASSFTIEIERIYPFHEALLRPCIDLSNRHQFAYAPIVWAGRGGKLTVRSASIPSVPSYALLFEGNVPGLERLNLVELTDRCEIEINDLAIGALFIPNPEVQFEVNRRARLLSSQLEERAFTDKDHLANAKSLFFSSLKSIWPAEAMGKLSSYVYLHDGHEDIRAFGVEVDISGEAISGRVAELYNERQVAPGIKVSDAPYESLIRTQRTDRLALDGVLSYRAGKWSNCAGWVIYASHRDPRVIVRSNGVLRWLCLGNDEFESIERLADGRNLALGPRTAWEMYVPSAINEPILFAGLGLGVVQRNYTMHPGSVTCENNRGVLDAFDYIYPEARKRLNIVIADFYDYVRQNNQSLHFRMAFLDFHDTEDRYFRADILRLILEISDFAVINRYVRDEADLIMCNAAIGLLPFRVERHVLDEKQLIVAVFPVDG